MLTVGAEGYDWCGLHQADRRHALKLVEEEQWKANEIRGARQMICMVTLNAEFSFEVDVAADRHNRKCPAYFGRDHVEAGRRDALTQSWASHACWLNPPYSNVAPWLQKACEEAQQGATVVVLVHFDPSTRWWAKWALKADEIRVLTGARVRFTPPDGVKASSNTRPSALLVFRKSEPGTEPKTVYWDWKKDLAA